MRGKTLRGIVHITDFYATFAGLAGVSAVDKAGPSPVDSIDQWQFISGAAATSARNDMVYEHRLFNNDTEYTGAVRRGKWKLVVSREHAAGWFGTQTQGVYDFVFADQRVQCYQRALPRRDFRCSCHNHVARAS